MKRTPLKRKSPLKRTAIIRTQPLRVAPVTRKPSKRTDEMRQAQDEWCSTQTRCAVCWHKGDNFARRLVLHHIVGRGKGFEIPANWLRLCDRCHKHYHDGGGLDDPGNRLPTLTAGMLLGCKYTSDKENYSPETLAALKHWNALPYDVEALLLFYFYERSRNDGLSTRKNVCGRLPCSPLSMSA